MRNLRSARAYSGRQNNAVHGDHEQAQDHRAEHCALEIPGTRGARDVGAEPVRGQRSPSPSWRPPPRCSRSTSPARGGDGAGHIEGKHRRQRHPPPPQPAAHAEILARHSADPVRWPRRPTMTLKRMYHCVPRIMSGLSQMSGVSLNSTMPETTIGKQQVRRERRQKLRDRLHDAGQRAAAAQPKHRWAPRSRSRTRSAPPPARA